MRFILFPVLFIPLSLIAQPFEQPDAAQLKLNLEKLDNNISVLYIAAHPDDENTRLISWLVNDKKARTAYLSLTRGDGGQNLIGTEKSELLGIIRTQELLAARKVDGAEQYFSRAIDFGYSKTPEETFEKWGKEEVLSDIVWVIRNFKPDIIITRFPSSGEGGHGHHTASAILAEEAFKAAADKEQFKWQLEYTEPWQAKRIMWNAFIRRNSKTDTTGFIKLDVGGYNALLGKSYGEIASKSRSMHKSQGFGSAGVRGPVTEYFKNIAGEPASENIFEGISSDWEKIPGSINFKKTITEILSKYNPSEPEQTLPLLLKAYQQASELKDMYWQERKKAEIENLITSSMGLWVEALAKDHSAVPGQEIDIYTSVLLRNDFPISLTGITIVNMADTVLNLALKKHRPENFRHTIKLPEDMDYTSPSWLKKPPREGLYSIDKPELYVAPQGPPAVEVIFSFNSGKVNFSVKRPLLYKWTDPVDGEKYRSFEIIPEVMINFARNVYLFNLNESSNVDISVKAGKEKVNGKVSLILPEGWKSEPGDESFSLERKEEAKTVTFKVFPSKDFKAGKPVTIKAVAAVSKDKYLNESITRIEHEHIPIQTYITGAQSKISPLDITIDKIKIAYIPGADDIPDYLEQLGYDLTLLTGDMIETADLEQFDAIITGIRAYNTNEKLKTNNRKLINYVQNGGNLVVQYNTSNFTGTIDFEIGPYPFKITRNRVTDENAKVDFIQASHPLLNYPNKISSGDFENWVQERGIYFAGDFRDYQTVLSMHDKGESPNQGSLIVTDYGKGSFIYTGLSFFRQLPAGVPGAYRLFVNLISYKSGNEK